MCGGSASKALANFTNRLESVALYLIYKLHVCANAISSCLHKRSVNILEHIHVVYEKQRTSRLSC